MFSFVAAKLGTGSSSQSRIRSPWCKSTGKIVNLSDANGPDDNGNGTEEGKNVKGSWEDEDNADAPCWKKQKEDW